MKAHIPTTKELIEKSVKETIQEEINKANLEVRETCNRKMIKLLCVTLNEMYGFGKSRNAQVISWITDLINEEMESVDNDSGDFWYKIDKKLQSIGCSFYDTEDNIKSKNSNAIKINYKGESI